MISNFQQVALHPELKVANSQLKLNNYAAKLILTITKSSKSAGAAAPEEV